MSSRERILAALRDGRALRGDEVREPSFAADHTLFRDYPDESSSLESEFARNFVALAGEWIKVPNVHTAAEALLDVLLGVRSWLCQPTPTLHTLRRTSPMLDRRLQGSDQLPRDARSMAHVEAGVTGADYFIARTGSIVLTSRSGGGRVLSVLPEVHVVLGWTSQCIPSLDEWLLELSSEQDCSMATVITGPSRTADIEKILVLGAHGPKRLIAIVIEGSPPSMSSSSRG